jgi:hypothetical protein
MKINVEVGGKDPASEFEQERMRKDRLKKKMQKRAIRMKPLAFLYDILGLAYWRFVFRRKYKYETPVWEVLKKDLTTPVKAFAWFSEFVDVATYEHQGQEIDTPQNVLKSGKASMKTMAYLYANLLHQYGYNTHVFWVGHTSGYMLPICAVVNRVYTLGLSSTYRVHFGDQFDIMRDYLKGGTTWKVMDRVGNRLIMSYIYGREPEIIVYDEEYWGKHQPLAYELATRLRLAKKGTEPNPEIG